MKKILLSAMVLLSVAAVSCSKERQCKCTLKDATDDNHLKILIVDHSMSCDDIKVMGIENTAVTVGGTQTLERTEMHEVSCRDYNN